MTAPTPEDEIDHALVTRVCTEYLSRHNHTERFTLEDAARLCRTRADRVAMLTELLPDAVMTFRRAFRRDPTCEELTQEHPSLRDEIVVAYEHLTPDCRYPTHLGRYRVVRVLSTASAQSIVVKGRDDGVGRDVAIKYSKRSADRARLRQEGELLERLKLSDGTSHRHLLHCHELVQQHDRTALVFEHLRGATLAGSPAPDPEEALRIAEQVADALAHCHERGVFHSDLSPGNVFLAEPARAVLIDFGLAVEQTSGGDGRIELPDLGGTREFFSPERLAGGVHRGDLSEVYSLGAVLYWILTDGQTLPLKDRDNAAPGGPLFDALPRAVRAVVRRALASDPTQRFGSAAELRDALGGLRRPRWKKRWTLAAGGLLLTVVASAAYLLAPHGRETPRVLAPRDRETPRVLAAPSTHPLVELLASPRVSSELIGATLRNALSSADVATLRLLAEQDLPPRAIEQAFEAPAPSADATVAKAFFESSRGSAEAVAWLSEQLAAGLDPDLVVGRDRKAKSLLYLALWSANKEAVFALLDAGASPHPYHSLIGSYAFGPSFLFPLGRLDQMGFSRADERDVAARLIASGVVVPEPLKDDWKTRDLLFAEDPFGASDLVMRTLRVLPKQWGVEVSVTPTLMANPRSPIADLRRPGEWDAFLEEMPKTLLSGPVNSKPIAASIQHLLGVFDDKAYFLGVVYQNHQKRYALFETSRPGDRWLLYAMRGQLFPMSGAFGDPTPVPGRSRLEAWEYDYWVGMRLNYDAERLEMTHEGTVYKVYRNASDTH